MTANPMSAISPFGSINNPVIAEGNYEDGDGEHNLGSPPHARDCPIRGSPSDDNGVTVTCLQLESLRHPPGASELLFGPGTNHSFLV